MDIKLIAANLEDLDIILQMQKEAFSELYARKQVLQRKSMRIYCFGSINLKRRTIS